MGDLKFTVFCKCGGNISFKVNTVSNEKQYVCPSCSANLGNEVTHVLVNIKHSLEHHCSNCHSLNNVQQVRIDGKLI